MIIQFILALNTLFTSPAVCKQPPADHCYTFTDRPICKEAGSNTVMCCAGGHCETFWGWPSCNFYEGVFTCCEAG